MEVIETFGDIEKGEFDPGFKFYVKNITNKPVIATVVPAKSLDSVKTVFYPGWNKELLLAVISAPDKSLLYGI